MSNIHFWLHLCFFVSLIALLMWFALKTQKKEDAKQRSLLAKEIAKEVAKAINKSN